MTVDPKIRFCSNVGVQRRHNAKKRIARLSPQEDKVWTFAFCYYMDTWKKGTLVADRMAWRDLVLEFPRLKRFSGCR